MATADFFFSHFASFHYNTDGLPELKTWFHIKPFDDLPWEATTEELLGARH